MLLVALFLVLDRAKEFTGSPELTCVGEGAAHAPVALALSPHL